MFPQVAPLIFEFLTLRTFCRTSPRIKVQDALLDFTSCLREQGLDVGDFGVGSIDPTEGRSETPRSPSDLVAVVLGQDPDDPAWDLAWAACFAVLATAFVGG